VELEQILVVDDEEAIREVVSTMLESKGYRCTAVSNGRAAQEQVKKSTPDLVLSDMIMPEMDGITATREIRKRHEWRKVPIIALTAKAMKDDQERCLAAGANDYIAKPLDVEKLLSLLRVWMPK